MNIIKLDQTRFVSSLRTVCCAVVCTAALVMCSRADLAPVAWTGGSSTSFNDAANWSVADDPSVHRVPGPGDLAVIDSGCAASVSVDADCEVGGLSISGASAFSMTGEGRMTLVSGMSAFRSQTDATFSNIFVMPSGVTNNFRVAYGKTVTFANDSRAVITGDGGLCKGGALPYGEDEMTAAADECGTLVLATANDFTGDVRLSYGFVEVGDNQGLGATNVAKRVHVGRNHYRSKPVEFADVNDVQLRFTAADMKIRYDIDTSAQCGAVLWETHIPVTFASNAFVYGDLDFASTRNDCVIVNAAGIIRYYGKIYVAGLFTTQGAAQAHYHGAVTSPAGMETAQRQIDAKSCSAPYFYSSENNFGSIAIDWTDVVCMGVDSIARNCYVLGPNTWGSAGVDVNGFNQHFDRIWSSSDSADASNVAKNLRNSSATPAAVTLSPMENVSAKWQFSGALDLIVDSAAGKTQSVVRTTNQMVGTIAVSNGAFRIALGAEFPKVNSFAVGANGAIVIEEGSSAGDGTGTLSIETGGKLVLGTGVTVEALRLMKDGTVVAAPNKTFQALEGADPLAERVDWIEGAGLVRIIGRTIEISSGTYVLPNEEVDETVGRLVQTGTSTFSLDNAEIYADVTTWGSYTAAFPIWTTVGSMNILYGKLTLAGPRENWCLVETDSKLTVEGDVLVDQDAFVIGRGQAYNCTFVLTNGVIKGTKDFKLNNIIADIWSSGNYAAVLDVQASSRLSFHVTDALTADTPLALAGWSTLDLCGCDQVCGSLTLDRATITSGSTAVLDIHQTADVIADVYSVFTGAVGLRKHGSAEFGLESVNTSTGLLEVVEGTLSLGAACRWYGTDVRISGAGAVLKIADAANLPRKTALSISDPQAKIDIAEGVCLRVRECKVASIQTVGTENIVRMVGLCPGDYNKDNCDFISGGGTLRVTGERLAIIIR